MARGDTLMKLLTANGVDRSTAHNAIQRLSEVYDVRRLQIGQDIALTFQERSEGLAFLGLTLRPSAERDIEVRADADAGFVAQEVVRELESATISPPRRSRAVSTRRRSTPACRSTC